MFAFALISRPSIVARDERAGRHIDPARFAGLFAEEEAGQPERRDSFFGRALRAATGLFRA